MTGKISAASLRRYLDGKKLTKGCQACGSTSLAVDGAQASDALSEIVMVFCSDCGTGRFYNRRTILEWLQANPLE